MCLKGVLAYQSVLLICIPTYQSGLSLYPKLIHLPYNNTFII